MEKEQADQIRKELLKALEGVSYFSAKHLLEETLDIIEHKAIIASEEIQE